MSYSYLKNLAFSDSGFLFDPGTGSTYTVNETGLFILNLLKINKEQNEIIQLLLEEYETTKEQAERDFSDLIIQLKSLRLIK
ncbi:MAG: HPr-rel-A system PqqD family peptide chaperone [Leptospiraceae bacterium]|nr:HPr-rel-A system PqqD family peptide chaperone [Leptospiraceae bacterium]